MLRIAWNGKKIDQKIWNFDSHPIQVHRKMSTGVDGGLSGGSSVRRPGSEDPHRRQRKLLGLMTFNVYIYSNQYKHQLTAAWKVKIWPNKDVGVSSLCQQNLYSSVKMFFQNSNHIKLLVSVIRKQLVILYFTTTGWSVRLDDGIWQKSLFKGSFIALQ